MEDGDERLGKGKLNHNAHLPQALPPPPFLSFPVKPQVSL